MTYPALKISEPTRPPSGWRDIGSPGWQYAWLGRLVEFGVWSRLTGGQMGVLVALLAHAGTEGECWPSVQRLAEQSGQKVRAVQYAIARFRDLRILDVLEADAASPRRRFVFLRWSEWALGDQVMASVSDVPARIQDSREGDLQVHVGASGVHVDAPQVHAGASGVHVDAPCIYRNGTEEIEISSSSESKAPIAQAGLFDDDALISLLESRGFVRRRAQALIREYEPIRIRDAVTHCDFLQAKGEIRKSYQAAFTGFLQRDFSPDARIAKEADRARRSSQDRLRAEQANSRSSPQAPSRPVQDVNAKTLGLKLVGASIKHRGATKEEQREIVRRELMASGWTPEMWERAIAILEKKQ